MRSIVAVLLFCLPFLASSQVNLNQGLVAHYPLNGNAQDVSPNANHGVPSGVTPTLDRFGVANGALSFDGVDDYIQIANSPSFNATSAISIAFYFKPERNGTQTIIGKTNFASGVATQFQIAFDFSLYPGILYGVNPAGNGCTLQGLNAAYCNTGGGLLPLNRWYCLVASFENGVQKLFVDGVLVQTNNASFTALNTCSNAVVNIGRWWSGDLQRFKGSIDDIRIYNRALNAEEAASLCSVPTSACSSWLYCANQGSYVSIGDLDVSGTQLTVEALINRTTPWQPGVQDYNEGDIVSKHQDPSNTNYLLRPTHGYITTTNGFFATPDVCDFALNQTYHVAMTYDGATLKFYRNGQLMSQVAATGTLIQNNFTTRIGMYTGAYLENFIGYINEVRIWNRARTALELQSNMSALPNPTTQTGLQAYYTFNSLSNLQGNAAWNGTLTNGVINATNPVCEISPDPCRQPTTTLNASFTAPDTVCVNNPVQAVNTTSGQTTNYWSFCAADLRATPTGTNLGNVGNQLSFPTFMDYVKVGSNYYGFVVNNNQSGLVRLDFGNSLLNTPTAVNLGNFGGIIPVGNWAEGIQVIQNEGQWYAILLWGDPLSTNSRLIRISFGANITNPTPIATNWGNIGTMAQPLDLHMFKNGNDWYGLVVNANNNTITRLSFTSSFNNTPTGVNLGNIGGLQYPTGICAIDDNGTWRAFVTNGGNTSRVSGTFSLTRLDFGNSLLNTPTGVNLGNPGNTLRHPRDITILRSCNQITGLIVNGFLNSPSAVKLDFNNDLTGTPVCVSLGNFGNMSFPSSISRLFRAGDDLYALAPNVDNSSITRFRFAGCTDASTPSSTLQNPPPVTYSNPGTYNINLIVDDGLPTQSTFCKPVVVVAALPHTPIQSIALCNINQPIKIGRTYPGATYQWSTGATTDSITVTNTGTFWVDMSYYGCVTRDSFQVSIQSADFTWTQNVCNPMQVQFSNQTIAPQSTNWNFGSGTSTQFSPSYTFPSYGSFPVTLNTTTSNGCNATITKNITVGIQIDSAIITNDTTICNNAQVRLNAIEGTEYCWFPSTGLSASNSKNPLANPPTSPMTYYLHAKVFSQNLVVNGDFSQGNVGFTSDYTYSPNPTTIPGSYMVGTTPPAWNSGFSYCGDHTSLTGNFMLIDGATTANRTVWRQTVTVQPNTEYTFSAYMASVININAPILNFYVNGVQLGNSLTGSPTPCLYHHYENTWNSGTNTSVTLSIVNMNTIQDGNDFVLDDIAFGVLKLYRDSVTITRERPVVSIAGDNDICPTQSTTLTASGASTYTWTPSTGLSTTTGSIVYAAPSANTTYTVTGTTQNGCTDQESIQVTILAPPTISTSNDTTICKNSSVQLTASGGTGYSWTPAATLSNPSIQNPVASPGITPIKYYVTVTDANSCTNIDSVMVDIRPDPVFAVSPDTLMCHRDTITLRASGGDVYSWTPAATLSNPNVANPRAYPTGNTTYQVHIIESVCNISADRTVVVSVEAPVVSVTGDNEICLRESTTLNAAGAGTYTWSPSTGLNSSTGASPVASPTATTVYTVTGTTQTGCKADASVTVTVNPLPTITITPDTEICRDGSIQLNAGGGVTYSWTPGTTLNNSNIANPVATPGAQPTMYHVTVTGANTCVNNDSVLISIRPDPVYGISPNQAICAEDSVRLNAAGGSSYQWTPAVGLSSPNASATWAYPMATTTYQVIVTDPVCNTSNTLRTTVTVNDLPDVQASSSNELDCSYGSSQLSATGADRYVWTPSIGLSNTTIRNPVATPSTAMTYTVTGTDINGCMNSDTVRLSILATNKGEWLMPNAFTPNGDGINDCYGVKLWGVIEKLDFSVYNRWGERIFHTTNPTGCWDGTYKGVKQDGNVFVYVISAVTNCGPVQRKGTFVLIR